MAFVSKSLKFLINNKCSICGKKLSSTDLVELDGRKFHKSCAKCNLCEKNLTEGDDNEDDGKLYCNTCCQIISTSRGQENQIDDTMGEVLINLETFSLLWLDADVHKTNDNIHSQVKLREAINFLQTFDQVDDCEENIRKIKYEKIVLIVSGKLGREIVPRLHHLPQLNSIYVYCLDKIGNKQWADKYSKVKGVFVDLDELIQSIIRDQKTRNKVEDSSAIIIFNRSEKEYTHKNLKSENSSFMWFQLLIEVLLCMENNLKAKTELIHICKKQYKKNLKELTIVDEFEKFYDGTNAIWWYTRESCLYRLLNKALRIQNIDILFAFRFFIKDLFDNLTREHEKMKYSSTNRYIRVYRGQIISTEEFDRIRKSIGEFISMNSFFSTSKNRKQALSFTQSVMPNDDVKQILFDIQIDVYLSTKPFADVTELSYLKEEKEILFMLGSVFRIINVTYSKDECIWIAELSLCNENDHDLRELFAYQKEKIGKNLADAVLLGDILFKMGEFDKAKQYYFHILNEISTNDRSIARCYFGLGNIAIEQDNYSTALKYHLEALNVKKKFLSGNDRDLASSYNQIGTGYRRLQNYDKALEYANVGLKMRLKCLDRNDVDLAQSYRDIGLIHLRLNKNDLALLNFTEADKIYTNVLPENHPDIAENTGYIGYAYKAIGEYDLAMQCYEQALAIDRKSLPEYHPDIGVICDAAARNLYNQEKYASAFEYCNQALVIFRKSLPPTHQFTRDTETMIELIKKHLSTASCEAH